jgi:SAM-dependent methyltransferase
VSVVPDPEEIETLHAEDRPSAASATAHRETEVVTLPQCADGQNPAAPRLEPPELVRGFFEQFGHPSGWLGGLAGLLMSRTSGDDKWVVNLLNIQPTDRVLDIGCGPGVTLQLLAERAAAGFLAGVDPSDVMLRQASRRNRHVLNQGRLELRRATAQHLPFPDGSFNKVGAVHSIYFWQSLEEGLREVRRVLHPAGRAVIAVRMRQLNAGRFDPSRYGLTEEDLDAVAGAAKTLGFREVTIKQQADLDRQTMAAVIAHK